MCPAGLGLSTTSFHFSKDFLSDLDSMCGMWKRLGFAPDRKSWRQEFLKWTNKRFYVIDYSSQESSFGTYSGVFRNLVSLMHYSWHSRSSRVADFDAKCRNLCMSWSALSAGNRPRPWRLLWAKTANGANECFHSLRHFGFFCSQL